MRRFTGLMALTLGLVMVAAGQAPVTAGPAINETRIIHLVRINCDDEAAHFSDEISLLINGVWRDSKTNMDGGDWWDLNVNGPFEDSIHVEIREWAGWTIGEATISTSEAGLGLQVRHFYGHQGTFYHYRLTYWVE
jgi:hypothetical protein